jgi:hypothetical protein
MPMMPSGKHTKKDGKSACSMGKSTISMAIFNSKLLNYQRGALNMDPGLVAIKATAFDRAPRRSTHKSCSWTMRKKWWHWKGSKTQLGRTFSFFRPRL